MVLIIYVAIILFGVGFDQITKYLAATNLPIDASPDVRVWEGVFHIRCISNDGAAFGMLDDQRWIFMTISSVVIVAVLVILVLKHKRIPLSLGIALSMVVSGGIGNMIDRIALGYVVDFIYFVPIDFPCFNVADSFVCIGSALMVICVLFMKEPEKEKSIAAESATAETVETEETVESEVPEESTETAESDADSTLHQTRPEQSAECEDE